MPLPGGAADKLGNVYEALWTASKLLGLINGQGQSIWLEPADPLGEGVEFVLTLDDGTREFHQVKRQHSGNGAWTISRLDGAKVLSHFLDKLRSDPDGTCVFVSVSSADVLRELTERAQKSRDATDFLQSFVSKKDISGAFKELRKKWGNVSARESFAFLKRITIKTISEFELRELANQTAVRFVDEEPQVVVDVLALWSMKSVHAKITAQDIWSYIEECGMRRTLLNNPHISARIYEINQQYHDQISPYFILGSALPRDETNELVQSITSETAKKIMVLSGEAGGGKSGVMYAAQNELSEKKWPTLIFRLDRLHDNSCVTARQLGERLDLPISPVAALIEQAKGLPCALFIDQLDAVSKVSGRRAEVFDSIKEILRQSEGYPNLRVVIACRHFDLQNDDRFRSLTNPEGPAQVIAVNGLSQETVEAVAARCGVEANRLSEPQKHLLKNPLHLKLFTEIFRRETFSPATFHNLKDLYDLYWKTKESALKERLGQEAREWKSIANALSQRMTQDEELSAPVSVLDAFSSTEVEAMVSEGMLIRQANRAAFFHETFFDYVFARRFISEGKRLLPFVQEGNQHLFLRSVVRQILTHKRADDFKSYLTDLQALLTADDVRFHLKSLVLQWLGALPDPRLEEWHILQKVMANIKSQTPIDEGFYNQAWGVLDSPAWFELVDSTGFVDQELYCQDVTRQERTINYLAGMVRHAPEVVAAKALAMVDKPDPWPLYARHILQRADADKSHQFIILYQKLSDKGLLDASSHNHPMEGNTPWFGFYDLAEKKPEWAIAVFEAWFRNRRKMAETNGSTDAFLTEHHDPNDALNKMAEAAPGLFVEKFLPILLSLVEKNALREGPSPWRDRIWPWFMWGGGYSMPEHLLNALVTALKTLVVQDYDAFDNAAALLHQHLDYRTAGFILARAYAVSDARHADTAIDFLLSNNKWLGLGWTDSSYWASRQVIEAATPHCSDAALNALEAKLLNFYSDWERKTPRYAGYPRMGFAQQALLNGISVQRRSAKVRLRLGELERKFGSTDDEPPKGCQTGMVGPPFNANWDKMNDKAWLNAVRRYQKEDYHQERRHGRQRDFLSGGAVQLSHQLQKQTQENPSRFAALAEKIPDTCVACYFDALLRGMEEYLNQQTKDGNISITAPITPEEVWGVLRRCHRLPTRPCGRAISSLLHTFLSAYPQATVPNDISDIVEWYAAKSPDPETETWRKNTDDDTVYWGGDPASAGLNSVRGGMAWAVAALLSDNSSVLPELVPVLEKLATDKSVAVRSQAIYPLLLLLNHDRDKAVDLFIKLCAVPPADEILLGTPNVWDFLRYGSYTHQKELMPILRRMLNSNLDKVVETGARAACFAALIEPSGEAKALAEACVTGSNVMRKEAATVAAANMGNEAGKEILYCENVLRRLFDDDSPETRKAASQCFKNFKAEHFTTHENFVETFIASRTFDNEAFWFFHQLEETGATPPTIICDACAKTVQILKATPRQERFSTARFSNRNSGLLLRLYEHTDESEVKNRCLNLMDEMLRDEPTLMAQSLLQI